MSIKTNKRQRELFFMLPTREYNMISSAYYDKVDKAKKKATLKMTGEDIQEKVFDEYSSLEELKELKKVKKTLDK